MTVLRAHRLLIVHAIVVAALTVLYAVLHAASFGAPGAGPEAGIGLLPAYVPLAALGVPWSCAFFVDPYAFDDAGDIGRQLVIVGPAWLNLAIHAVGRIVRTRRSRKQSGSPADPA